MMLGVKVHSVGGFRMFPCTCKFNIKMNNPRHVCVCFLVQNLKHKVLMD